MLRWGVVGFLRPPRELPGGARQRIGKLNWPRSSRVNIWNEKEENALDFEVSSLGREPARYSRRISLNSRHQVENTVVS